MLMRCPALGSLVWDRRETQAQAKGFEDSCLLPVEFVRREAR
jgi:hypothetical protein